MTKLFSEFQIKKCWRRYKMVATLLGILVVRICLILNSNDSNHIYSKSENELCRVDMNVLRISKKYMNYAGLIRW